MKLFTSPYSQQLLSRRLQSKAKQWNLLLLILRSVTRAPIHFSVDCTVLGPVEVGEFHRYEWVLGHLGLEGRRLPPCRSPLAPDRSPSVPLGFQSRFLSHSPCGEPFPIWCAGDDSCFRQPHGPNRTSITDLVLRANPHREYP